MHTQDMVTLFGLKTDTEIATVKAALDVASDYWEGIVCSTRSDAIREMAQQQQQAMNTLAKRITEECW